ncbi:Na+/H+ antiporter NhaC family protein [Bacillus sp. AK031]
MSTAAVLGMPPEITAGALVSGAFVGDRTSPFSSSHQLLSHTVETDTGKQFSKFLPTTLGAVLVCLVFYFLADTNQRAGNTIFSSQDFQWEDLSLIKFLPPLILILFVLFRIRILYAFICSVLAAAMIALVDGVNPVSVLKSLWFGVDGIGGGLSNMYFLLLFLALAGAYNGLLEGFGIIQPLLNNWLRNSKGLAADSLKTIFATLVISLISANQTLPIILTGRSFINHWKDKYGNLELARVMGDSTMVFPGMIPWSVLAIMCSTILGVPILAYLPYAVFLWSLPLLTIIFSFYREYVRNKVELSS